MNRLFLIMILFAWPFSTNARECNTVEELKEYVCEVLPKLEGWCSKEKALSFIDLVLEEKPKICVEIGVFGGGSLFPVASALKFLNNGGFVIGIDPWNNNECVKDFDPLEDLSFVNWWSKVDFDKIYASFRTLIKWADLEDYRLVIRTTSENAAAFIDTIDILYLDGNHSIASLVSDVDLYLPKVRSGGYVWVNDIHRENIGVALMPFLQECEFVRSIDDGNCILFKKL